MDTNTSSRLDAGVLCVRFAMVTDSKKNGFEGCFCSGIVYTA